MRNKENYPTGPLADFWGEHCIRDGHEQPGNPEASGELSSSKAKTILHDGSVRGHKLTPKQKRFMGFVAGGGHPSK